MLDIKKHSMLESIRENSIGQTFRHQQSETLSHLWEPSELPPRPSKFRRSGVPPRTKSRTYELLKFDEGQFGQTKLLSKHQEQQLARKIYRFRQSFQRKILQEPAVLEHVVNLLRGLVAKETRVDAVCNLGMNQTAKRNRVESILEPSLKRLSQIHRRLKRTKQQTTKLHRETVQLVENLTLRPQHFESAPFQNAQASELLETYQRLSQQMVLVNLRLVIRVANQICNTPTRAQAIPDMIQEGNRGLIHAVTKFEPQCNVRFSTYAIPWIKQAILGALPNSQRSIRIPENFLAISRKVHRALRQLQREQFEIRSNDAGRVIALLAIRLKMNPADVAQHLCVERDTCSINNGTPEQSSLSELLADRRQSPREIAESNERTELVQSMMSQVLTRREHDVISLRFGFGDGQDRSFAEVGEVVGLSRQRVCQVEKQALAKLEKLTACLAVS